MMVTIEFSETDLQPALQLHFNEGVKVQDYIKAALQFYNDCRSFERSGHTVGYGNDDNMKRYHKVIKTNQYLGIVEREDI